MDLGAFAAAPAVIQLHAICATGALVLGAVQLGGPKGTLPHRALGMVWAGLMAITAVTALFIHRINEGGFSSVHLFIPLTLFGLVGLARTVQMRQWRRHRRIVTSLYFGALIIPGLFTFVPGRLMHDMFLAGPAG